MSEQENTISNVEKAYISIGASIGSGCVYCLNFHQKNAKSYGLTDNEINSAVSIAEEVKQKTIDKLKNNSRESGGVKNLESEEEITPMNKEKLLTAFGAALGTNNSDEIRRLLPLAFDIGLTKEHIATTAQITRKVKKNADEICGKTVLDYFQYLDKQEGSTEGEGMCSTHGHHRCEESQSNCYDDTKKDDTKEDKCAGHGGHDHGQGPGCGCC